MNDTKLQTTSAADEEFARELEIVEDSVIKPIVRRKLHVGLSHADTSKRNQDAMDLVGDIRLILLSELHQTGKSNGHIRSISSYAATVTFNKCYEHFRSLYPQRASLRNKVRYLLTHDPGFALWRDSGGRWLCGFAEWNGRDEHVSSHVDDDDLARIGSDREASAEVIRGCFSRYSGPVFFDELVNRIAAASGLVEPTEFAEDLEGAHNIAVDPKLPVDAALELTSRLRCLWAAVLEIPPQHRKVLLLNLSDNSGDNLLAALPLTGVASINEIATAVDMSREELAQIWNSLPWEDNRIAESLGLTRQQVINLRQTARAKLTRRRRETGNI